MLMPTEKPLEAKKAEQLITANEVAARLAISKRTLERKLASLQAGGLQTVRIGRNVRFRESSVNKLIRRAAERGSNLLVQRQTRS
jgi:excisionase family DNA binding protein